MNDEETIAEKLDNAVDWLRVIAWNLAMILIVIAAIGCSMLSKAQEPADFAPAPEPKPASVTVDIPTAGYVEIIREQSADAYENSTDAIAVAEAAKRDAKEAKELAAANNEQLLKINPNTTLQERIDELTTELKATRELLAYLAPHVQVPSPPALDFTHHRQLPNITQGYVAYHVQANAYGLDQLQKQLRRTPIGSYVLVDYEPWTQSTPWYGDATEAENLDWMAKYAKLIRDVTPLAHERRITLGTYSVPSLMPRSYSAVRRQPGDPIFDKWLSDQRRVIDHAEKSGLLPAIRDANGVVWCVGYFPASFDTHASGEKWIRDGIANQSRILDERGIEHRWLFQPSPNDDLNRAMVESSKGRCDWWEDTKRVEFEEIGKLLEGK